MTFDLLVLVSSPLSARLITLEYRRAIAGVVPKLLPLLDLDPDPADVVAATAAIADAAIADATPPPVLPLWDDE